MFIKNCLTPTRDLEILKTGTTIGEALDRMNQVRLYSLPVVDQAGNFIGILSKQSMFEFLEKNADQLTFSEFRKQLLDDCIDHSAQTFVDIEKDHFEDCLPIIVRHPFVPVVGQNHTFVGIVKRSAIERALASSFGSNIPGVRYMIAVDDAEGTLLKIAQTIYDYDVNIISAIPFEAGDTFLRRILLKVAPNNHVNEIAGALEAKGYRVLEISMK